MPDKKGKQEETEKTNLIQDKSIHAIKILIEEISKNNNTSINEIFTAIQSEFNNEQVQTTITDKKPEEEPTKEKDTTDEDKISETKNKIPITLFLNNAGYLELLTYYMKETLQMPLSKIARSLNRDQRTIWSSYNNAKQKVPKLKIEKTSTFIPIDIFSNREQSPLSSITAHLSKEITLKEIAKLLKKDYRTIWTAHNRTKTRRKKNE